MDFSGRGARIRMTEETFRCGAGDRYLYYIDWNQGSTEHNPRNRRYRAYMGCLAEPTGCLILTVRMSVRRDLQEKYEGKQGKTKRQRTCHCPPGFMT
jgi:hypothetical protein